MIVAKSLHFEAELIAGLLILHANFYVNASGRGPCSMLKARLLSHLISSFIQVFDSCTEILSY